MIWCLPVFQYYSICCLGTPQWNSSSCRWKLIENDLPAPKLHKPSLRGPQSSQYFCPNTRDNSFTCGISRRLFCLAGHCSIYITPVGGGNESVLRNLVVTANSCRTTASVMTSYKLMMRWSLCATRSAKPKTDLPLWAHPPSLCCQATQLNSFFTGTKKKIQVY